MLFDRLHGGGAGHSPGPSDEAKLKLPWLPKPAFAPPFLPLWPWEIQNFQNVPSLSSSRLGDVKPGTTKKKGKREPYLSYACNLFLQLPHARRYVNAPSAPTTAPARPGPGAWHSSVPGEGRHEEAEGPLALQRRGKGKATERQLHSIKCSSRAKVRRRGTASSKRGSRNAQSRVISVLTIEEAAERNLVEDLYHQNEGVNQESRQHGNNCMKLRVLVTHGQLKVEVQKQVTLLKNLQKVRVA
ncbi:uncharacterized protein LOC123790526 [Ursus americanus]|uniref:uncharacterized protein LOC123790526 n=1 Tax=Ursus americanus TaxID=9643 RepID=UPI001E67D5E3|nr:uncharacterized protein LOC123790526 [Ursus americanus]